MVLEDGAMCADMVRFVIVCCGSPPNGITQWRSYLKHFRTWWNCDKVVSMLTIELEYGAVWK